MSMTDPIADFLTRLRNGAQASKEVVEIPSSRLKRELARILREQGYIEDFEVQPPAPGRAAEQIVVRLKYTEDRKPVISKLQRVSRPGRRVYVDSTHIPKALGGMGTVIVSTSSGVMTGHEARAAGVGGEVVAEIW
jgi:small subunit ribosomal protein S8